MKKLVYISQILFLSILFSSAALADGHGWGHHGHHGWGHHHGHHHGHRGWGGGYAPQVNYYYPQPNYYYQQPPVQYYPPQPQYQGGYGYDNRTHQGLAGGVVGSVFGYELGNGHPLATGIGAAAGSFLGNGVGWRY